ncbi:MAG: hypothetical protein HY867_06295 [Chloroflexi bacterium]|nr:hypothetical protein [Chloroflexota bacterium]
MSVRGNFYTFRNPVPSTMPIREAEMLVEKLKELRKTATMDSTLCTEEVKRDLKVWRETWLIAPLDDLIERYSAVSKRKQETGVAA